MFFRSTISCMCVFAVASLAAAQSQPVPSTQPAVPTTQPAIASQPTSDTATGMTPVDLSSPKAAVISFFRAGQAHDTEAKKKTVFMDESTLALWEAIEAYDKAKTGYMDAVGERFGAEAAKKMGPDVKALLIAQVEKADVKIDGDTAEIGEHGDYPCRRVDGEWRLDFVRYHKKTDVSEMTKYLLTAKSVYEAFAQEIAQGKYASIEEIKQALQPRMPFPPLPKNTSN